MAHLIPREYKGKVTWFIAYYPTPKKRKLITTRTGDRRKAEKRLRAWEEQRTDQAFGVKDSQHTTLDELFRLRHEWLVSQNRAPNSIDLENHVCSAFAAFFYATPSHHTPSEYLSLYAAYRRGSGLNPTSINMHLRHLRAIFNWGAERGLCSPAKISLVKTESHHPVFLSESEVERFLGVIDDPYWRRVFVFYLYTGGRRDEVANLTWEDVDLERGIIRFRKTKSGSEREVPISEALRKLLDPCQGKIFKHQGAVIYRHYRGYVRKAGITDKGKEKLHTLRHTFASHLVMSGVDLATVKELLGHSSITVTMRYAHLSREHLKSAVEKLWRH